MVVSTVLERNPEINFSNVIRLDKVVSNVRVCRSLYCCMLLLS